MADALIKANTPRSREDRTKIADLSERWTALATGLRHRNAAAVVHEIFDPELPDGPITKQLRNRVLRSVAVALDELKAEEAASPPKRLTTAVHLRELLTHLSEAVRLPDHATFAANVERLAVCASGREAVEAEAKFAVGEARIEAALLSWDIPAARTGFQALSMDVSDAESRRESLHDKIEQTAERARRLDMAIEALKPRKKGGRVEFAAVASDLGRLDALLADGPVPPPKRDAARAAEDTARQAALEWAAAAAAGLQDLPGLLGFMAEFGQLPARWREAAKPAWFSRAWSSVLANIRANLDELADHAAVTMLVSRVTPLLEQVEAPLSNVANNVARSLRSLEAAWSGVSAGVPPNALDLDALGVEGFLPGGYRAHLHAAEQFAEQYHELMNQIEAVEETTAMATIDAIADATEGARAQSRPVHGADWRAAAAPGAQATFRGDIRRVARSGRRDDPAAGRRFRADRRLVGLKDRSAELRGVAAIARQSPSGVGSRVAWWLKWIDAMRALGNAEDLPLTLDDSLRAISARNLTALVSDCEALLRTEATGADDLRELANELARLPWFGQVRELRVQLLREALNADFAAALAKRDVLALDDIVSQLRGTGRKPGSCRGVGFVGAVGSSNVCCREIGTHRDGVVRNRPTAARAGRISHHRGGTRGKWFAVAVQLRRFSATAYSGDPR